MRALCGAIITAGALIGLGLTALGIGTRYQHFSNIDAAGNVIYLQWRQLDTPLMILLVVLGITLCVGLLTAFLGLAFHHERRQREHQLALQHFDRPRNTIVS